MNIKFIIVLLGKKNKVAKLENMKKLNFKDYLEGGILI